MPSDGCVRCGHSALDHVGPIGCGYWADGDLCGCPRYEAPAPAWMRWLKKALS